MIHLKPNVDQLDIGKHLSPLQICIQYAIVVIWCLCIGIGFVNVNRWSTTPGSKGDIQEKWPTESKIVRVDGQAQIVFFVHPKCPCSLASATELRRIAISNPSANIVVVFICPLGTDSTFAQGDIVAAYSQIPGVQCATDIGGIEAKIFGAKTSGHMFLYGESGVLQFEGGITISRGHEGENDATLAVSSLLAGKFSPIKDWPVLGCAVESKNESDKESVK